MSQGSWRQRACLWGVAVFFQLGCGSAGQEDRRDWTSEVHHAGDTLILRTLGGHAARLDLVPERMIGEVDGAEEVTFARVGLLASTSAGGVLVWDQGARALRQFGAAGEYLHTIGRAGSGPGEYRSIAGVVELQDGRIAAWDAGNGRINIYAASGEHITSWRAIVSPAAPDALTRAYDGSLLLLGFVDEWNPERPMERRRGILRIDASDGSIRDTVIAPPLPPGETVRASLAGAGQSGWVWFPLPFAPQPQWAVMPSGEFAVGTGAQYAVTVVRQDGTYLRIERDVPRVTVDATERAYHRQLIESGLRQTDPSWRWHGADVPRDKPFLTGINIGQDGTIWVQRPQRGFRVESSGVESGSGIGGETWYQDYAFDVFSDSGAFVGSVQLPRNADVMLVSRRAAWGVIRDSVDVPYIVRWRVD